MVTWEKEVIGRRQGKRDGEIFRWKLRKGRKREREKREFREDGRDVEEEEGGN